MNHCKLLLLLFACTYCTAIQQEQLSQNSYLYNTVITRLDQKIIRCSDFYSYTCGIHNSTIENASKEYWKTMERAKNILSSNDAHGFSSLATEEELYQECLHYGHDGKQALKELKEKVIFFDELLSNIATNKLRWQKIDQKIAKLGLGNAFFNIKVIRDPLNSRKRIIMLEPPSLMSLNNMRVTLDYFRKVDLNTLQLSDKTSIIHLFKKIKGSGFELVILFFDYLSEIIRQTSSPDRSKILSERMTIEEWSKKYNRRSKNPTITTEIIWPEIIMNEFYKVNISLYDREPLIVKNIHYFSRLFNLLFETPNDIIGAAIVTKVAAENLRYIDFDFAQHLHKRDRATFCLTETKLYGVSHKILFDLSKDSIYNKESRKIQEIVNTILDSIKNMIYKAPFSFAEESYLLTEVREIVTHLGFLAELEAIDNIKVLDSWPSSLPEYYEPFKKSNSYFNNILKYREMLKMKELRSLKSLSRTLLQTPFSLIDIDIPANRFVLNVFLHRELFKKNYYKEQVYGTYGAKLATLIYGLLNENKALDTSYYEYDLRAHPHFDLDESNCVDLRTTFHTLEETYRIISSSVGLDIAFNALLKSSSDTEDLPAINGPIHYEQIWDAKQFFFIAYGMAHCDLNHTVLNNIVSHSTMFSTTLPDCHSECTYVPFNNVNKNIFLIKL